jgi:hypothetical protein
MTSMPLIPMSSRRPMKGDTKVAPARAASRAWLALKHSVTLTMVPPWVSARQALRPSHVSGTLTAMLGAISARWRPSPIMPSASSAVTSALTGPSTRLQISLTTSLKSRPDLAMREGLVVTPSMSPIETSSRMSSMSAVSAKNFMSGPRELAKDGVAN